MPEEEPSNGKTDAEQRTLDFWPDDANAINPPPFICVLTYSQSSLAVDGDGWDIFINSFLGWPYTTHRRLPALPCDRSKRTHDFQRQGPFPPARASVHHQATHPPSMIRAKTAGRSSSEPAAATPSTSSTLGSSRPSPGETQTPRSRRRKWRDGVRTLLRQGGQQLREALIGELPASLSLRTKVRIILEVRTNTQQGDRSNSVQPPVLAFLNPPSPLVSTFPPPSAAVMHMQARPLGHVWMIYQIALTLLSCAFFAISTAYEHDARGLFIEEMVFGASVLVDLLLRFYASDHRCVPRSAAWAHGWFWLQGREGAHAQSQASTEPPCLTPRMHTKKAS